MPRPAIPVNVSRAPPELQPPCPLCGNPMWLTRLTAYRDAEELRTFKCQVCDHTESRTVPAPQRRGA